MKRFEFELKSVLRVRRHQEELQRQKFASARKKRQELEQRKASIEQEVAQCNDRRNRAVDGSTPVSHRQHYSYLHQQQQAVRDLEQQIAKAEQQVEQERTKLVEANKKTRILENLEAKQKAAFHQKVERLEQKQINEIATQRFNWQRR